MWQCRYGGVEVPDQLWQHYTSGKGKKYSDNQAEDVVREEAFMRSFDGWVAEFEQFVRAKGKIEPGKWRAYGFKKPFNPIKELRTGIRSWKLRFGKPPKGSSPWYQQGFGLNKDATLHPKKKRRRKIKKVAHEKSSDHFCTQPRKG